MHDVLRGATVRSPQVRSPIDACLGSYTPEMSLVHRSSCTWRLHGASVQRDCRPGAKHGTVCYILPVGRTRTLSGSKVRADIYPFPLNREHFTIAQSGETILDIFLHMLLSTLSLPSL